MKNILQKLTPGERRKRSAAPHNRWLGWAQSLAGRHARVAESRRGLSLTFLRPAAPLLFNCERWTRAAWAISPQINLSISPVLRSLQPIGGDESTDRQMPERQRTTLLSGFNADSGGKTIAGRRGEPSPIGAVEQIIRQSPLQRVFVRAMDEESGGAAAAYRIQRETLLIERSLRMTRRVVDERLRVEEPARRTLVARESRSAPRTTAAVRETAMQSPRGALVGARGMMQAAAPPIDIEQLTDRVVRNIDSRIIAHRERMGKLF
ncbi:MAG TPA: hypothetical protein VFY40_24480 [Blastocatellia bacterium]|nr:hypothetical protein [Blastocatellia bacterium]